MTLLEFNLNGDDTWAREGVRGRRLDTLRSRRQYVILEDFDEAKRTWRALVNLKYQRNVFPLPGGGLRGISSVAEALEIKRRADDAV